MLTIVTPSRHRHAVSVLLAVGIAVSAVRADAPQTAPTAPAPPQELLPADMRSYRQTIPGTRVGFDMIALPGGTFTMGSAETETGRNDDEGPRHAVELAPFWIGKCEVTWDEYDIWSQKLDREPPPGVDAVARPTPPYCDMTFGMGHDGYPAICMTQLAARTYCEWLSATTGHHYRLPTEAEWEYACRAGTDTAYSFGDDPEQIDEYAWFVDNSDEEYHPVGQKRPNPWGLHDMHGNVAEWVLDAYAPDTYAGRSRESSTVAPLLEPTKLYPRVVRGGSWEDEPGMLRSAARLGSDPTWKEQDPQIPKSIWYHTDALFLGFRVVRVYETAPPKGDAPPGEAADGGRPQ